MALFSSSRPGLLAMTVLAGLTTQAEASGWLWKPRGHHHGEVVHDVVRVPGREIVVETERPRVIVSETRERAIRGRAALVAPPVVATFFTPVGMPLSPMLSAESRFVETRSTESGALRSMHDLEYTLLEVEKARAAHEAERRTLDRKFGELSRSFRSDEASAERSTTSDRLRNIEAELQKLATRLENVEKLTIIHDDLLKSKGIK